MPFAEEEEEENGANDLLRLSQDLLAIESDNENTSQRPSSQNTLVEAVAAINGLTSPSRLQPLTYAGSPSTEERKEEDEVTADVSIGTQRRHMHSNQVAL